VLRGAVEQANDTILAAAAADINREGMGTTVVVAMLGPDGQVVIANVGDSRAYAVLGGQVGLVTADHTWVNEQVQAGLMTERQARFSHYRNLLTRALGTAPSVEVDLFALSLGVGDALILVSDGVTGYLDASDIATTLRNATTSQRAAEALVDQAVGRAGTDNATAVVVIRRR
jgi:serine/threonine protein phosphatase PrpC